MPFRIYKGDSVIVEGESPLAISNLAPNTSVARGEYQATRYDGEKESERVDVPAFQTLPIAVTSVTLSPKTSSAEAGTEGSRQLNAVVAPVNATNKVVSYEITPKVEGLTLSAGGNISWTADTPAGAYTTTVTTEDGSKKDTHVLTLTEPEVPEEV